MSHPLRCPSARLPMYQRKYHVPHVLKTDVLETDAKRRVEHKLKSQEARYTLIASNEFGFFGLGSVATLGPLLAPIRSKPELKLITRLRSRSVRFGSIKSSQRHGRTALPRADASPRPGRDHARASSPRRACCFKKGQPSREAYQLLI